MIYSQLGVVRQLIISYVIYCAWINPMQAKLHCPNLWDILISLLLTECRFPFVDFSAPFQCCRRSHTHKQAQESALPPKGTGPGEKLMEHFLLWNAFFSQVKKANTWYRSLSSFVWCGINGSQSQMTIWINKQLKKTWFNNQQTIGKTWAI